MKSMTITAYNAYTATELWSQRLQEWCAHMSPVATGTLFASALAMSLADTYALATGYGVICAGAHAKRDPRDLIEPPRPPSSLLQT